VVKYGHDPKLGFVYSEVNRGYGGGHTLLDYPLAYLDRLYMQRLPTMRHPQWYDTQPSWWDIVKAHHDEFLAMRVGSHTQAYGFYGYEMVTPVDFFSVMAHR